MQKQGFYSAHHCCCTNARLLGIYPGHQFGKLELKKKQYWNWNFYWNWESYWNWMNSYWNSYWNWNNLEFYWKSNWLKIQLELEFLLKNPIGILILEFLYWNSYWKFYWNSYWNWIEFKDGHDTWIKSWIQTKIPGHEILNLHHSFLTLGCHMFWLAGNMIH